MKNVKADMLSLVPEESWFWCFWRPRQVCLIASIIEQLNDSIQYQLFSKTFLGPGNLSDFKVISRILTELAYWLNLRTTQEVLAKAWKPYIENSNILLEDTNC